MDEEAICGDLSVPLESALVLKRLRISALASMLSSRLRGLSASLIIESPT
jgi:hypothetical protein